MPHKSNSTQANGKKPEISKNQTNGTDSKPRLVRISVVFPEAPKATKEFPIDVLSLYSSTIKKALEEPGTNHIPHVAKSGYDEQDGKAFIVLKDLGPQLVFGALEEIMRASKVHGIKYAQIRKNIDLWELAMIFRAGAYLGTDYIMKTAEHCMRKKVPYLVTRHEAESIYRDFAANTLSRQIVIESIAEELLSQVLGDWVDENQVWEEVFVANFDGIKDLAPDVNKYYYHHVSVRRIKKSQHKARYLAAEIQREKGGEAPMEPLPTVSTGQVQADAPRPVRTAWQSLPTRSKNARTGGRNVSGGGKKQSGKAHAK